MRHIVPFLFECFIVCVHDPPFFMSYLGNFGGISNPWVLLMLARCYLIVRLRSYVVIHDPLFACALRVSYFNYSHFVFFYGCLPAPLDARVGLATMDCPRRRSPNNTRECMAMESGEYSGFLPATCRSCALLALFLCRSAVRSCCQGYLGGAALVPMSCSDHYRSSIFFLWWLRLFLSWSFTLVVVDIVMLTF